MKEKNHIVKRLMAFILVLITLVSTLSVLTYAGDSVFLETLINTDKHTYVANFTSDTKNKNKKYAYKYMNLAYVLGTGCDLSSSLTDGSLNNANTQKDPNYCFRLNYQYKYSSWSDLTSSSDRNPDAVRGSSALSLYMLLEGYFNDSGMPITNDDITNTALSSKSKEITKAKAKKQVSPLSYPGWYDNTITNEQSEYAQEKLIELVSSLNSILVEVNDGQKFSSTSELVNKSIMIRPADNTNIVKLEKHTDGYRGYVIVYADLTSTSSGVVKETTTGEANRKLQSFSGNSAIVSIPSGSSASFLNTYKLPRANIDNELYAYVFPIESNGTQINLNNGSLFVYAVPKGFTKISSDSGTFVEPMFKDGTEVYDYVNSKGDTPWISIHMLSFYANTVYKQYNVSINTYVSPDSNVISELIGKIFSGILNAIRSVLGLSSIEDLVFNLGNRGSAAFNFGLMSDNWWNIVLQYQLVFQAIAWVVLVCGLIKTLIELNLSTINPQKRSSVYDTIQKFIVVGIGLVILIPAVQFLLECNDTLVGLFAAQVDTASLNMPIVTNVLVQFIVGMTWLTIMLYINFIYIMRSITIALLIASGPFFIATIAWGHGGRSSLFTSWARELMANIFVQSVHAFVLSFLVQLLSTGTFLETFAIAISIIPITEMFRNLIFAGAGGSTSQMATTAAGAMKSGITAVGKGVTAGVVGGAQAIAGSGDKTAKEDGEGGGGGGGGGGKSQQSIMGRAMQNKMSRIGNGTSYGSKKRDDITKKLGGGKGAQILGAVGGAAIDGLGVAGLAAAGMGAELASNMATLTDNFGDLALKGDYSGLSKTMEGMAKNQTSNFMGGVKSGRDSARDAKARKAEEKAQVDTSNTSQMGAQAQQADGSTAGGAQMATQKATGHTKVGGVSTTNVSAGATDANGKNGTTTAQRAQVLADYRAAKANGKATATKAFVDGKHGTQLNYTDQNGKDHSVFMDDDSQREILGDNANGNHLQVDGKDALIDQRIQEKIATGNGDTSYAGKGAAASYRRSEMDISGTSVENRKAGLEKAKAAVKAGTGSSQDVKIKGANGEAIDGKRFTYPDAKGQEQSFVMSNESIKEANASQAKPAEKFDRSLSAGAKPTATHGFSAYSSAKNNEDQAVRAAMASKHGQDMGTYLDDQGQVAGHIYNYDGQQIAVSNEQIANAGTTIENHQAAVMNGGGELEYKQSTESMAVGMADKYAGDAKAENVVMNAGENATSRDAIVDAAMVSTLGTAVKNAPGTYTFGGKTFETGMSKSQAQQILQSRGINDVGYQGLIRSVPSDTVTYKQSAPSASNAAMDTTRHANGMVHTKYNTHIGKTDGPSWTSDGSGGGTMKFKSSADATRYFMAMGEDGMASRIAQTKEGTSHNSGIHTFANNGGNGFEVKFDGQAMRQQGMRMETSADGENMFISSYDATPKNAFRVDESPVVNQSNNQSSNSNTNTINNEETANN